MSIELKARMALTEYGFRFTHSLGQNFLLNDRVIADIADEARITPGENVLEIGAGAGVLTAALLERGANVVALEIDRALMPVLQTVLAGYENARVVFEDALKCDLNALFGGKRFRVVANLPYYITADVMTRLLTGGFPIESIVVMVQKEAGERLMARPGDASYAALSAIVAYFGEREKLMDVPRASFTPAPHVDSALLRVKVYDEKPVQAKSDAGMIALIRAAFAMRRKTLQNNLTASYKIPKEKAAGIIAECGLDARVRGEALSLRELAMVADRI